MFVLGWFLFLPPRYEKSDVDTTAPLSQWDLWRSFDTAKECEAYRDKMLDPLLDKKQRNTDDEYRVHRYMYARCIPSESIQFK
jgi:hypothetical protein